MLGNWIRQITTTTGTGNLTVTTVSGYAAFSDYFATSERFKYAILDDSTGAPIEAGIGYLSGGAVVREVIEATMVSGVLDRSNPSAVSLGAGDKRVICTSTAGTAVVNPPGVWAATHKGYGSLHTAGSAGTLTLTVDRAYAVPFAAAVDAEVDAVLVRVTTAAAAGKLLKVGIWSVGSDGLPGVSLAESSTIAADTTGVKVGSFTRFRPPPRFFAVLVSDGATGVQSYGTTLAGNAMGFDSSLVPNGYIYHTGATSLTFPGTWTPVGVLSSVTCPQLVCRVP
jgi:hypothetical protein